MNAQQTVYVVDDDPATRETLSGVIRSWGWSCQTYASSEDFLSQCNDSQPGCLIADLRMSGMDGIELQKELVNRQSTLPVVILTAYADVRVAVRAMQCGAITVLEKPHDAEELRQAVQRGFEINAQTRQRLQRRRELLRRLERLTPKERQVMDLLVDGKLNKDIATQLRVGLRTVERRRHNILEKMQVGSLPELSRIASELHEPEPTSAAR